MPLTDFYENTTKKFYYTITYNGGTPDISGDEVKFYLKDNLTDANYILTASADVTSSGSIGQARFTLSDEVTNINPEIYYYETEWSLANGDKYILDSNSIRIMERI